MKTNFSFFIVAICLSYGFNAMAGTVLQCAVKKVPSQGARINIIENSKGQMRANLIFGTTVSGTMYTVTEVKPGTYQGTIKSDEKFWLKLSVSLIQSENRYIRGYKSSLEVVYPDLRKASGFSHFKSSEDDEFTCGKQIRGYRE